MALAPSTDSVVRITRDDKYLDPPGGGRAFLASEDGTPRIEVVRDLAAIPAPGAALYVVDAQALDELRARGGERAVRRALRRLGRAVAPAPVAAGMDPDGPFDLREADIALTPLPATAGVAEELLAAGIRAGGRPLLVDVTSPDTQPDDLIAAFDVGAAGAIVRSGEPEADRALIEETAGAEAARLDGAPLISVVVCSYNGGDDLDRCLASLEHIDYPSYEVIVVDDGSKDHSVEVAKRHGVKVVEREGGGLARGRNSGLEAAAGEIVAYIDQDAEATPWWLSGIWRLIDRLGVDGAAGPNLPFESADWQERVVSAAPAAAMPVVHHDGSCSHFAGCNMTFRRAAALEVGGFNPSITGAYDDVDFCFRMLDGGYRLAFQPVASVYHHRRGIKGFWRQQRSYGVAEVTGRDGAAGTRDVFELERRTLLQRIDPRRPRYVFGGPQARQHFTLATDPLHVSLPFRVLSAVVAVALLGAPAAWRVHRLGAWSALSGTALLSLFVVVAARVPVFAQERGPRGLAQRIATAGLWFAWPIARMLGRRQASRQG